jgi:hypothetical protein
MDFQEYRQISRMSKIRGIECYAFFILMVAKRFTPEEFMFETCRDNKKPPFDFAQDGIFILYWQVEKLRAQRVVPIV